MSQHRNAIRALEAADPVLAALIDRIGPCRFEPVSSGTHFHALTRSIVYQQLSGKAAGTIFGRFNALYVAGAPEPEEVLQTDDEQLRGVGLSRQKIGYLRDLSEKVVAGELPLEAIETMDDGEVITHLVQVKGIGRWTAQMFLMFRLGRPDVLPELDLGIQTAIQREYRKRTRPTPKQVQSIGSRWSPYRSIASWYLWRSLDNGDGQLA